MADIGWHCSEQGSWWRPSTRLQACWHALAMYDGWDLSEKFTDTNEPPFLWPFNDRVWLPSLRSCKRIASQIETEREAR